MHTEACLACCLEADTHANGCPVRNLLGQWLAADIIQWSAVERGSPVCDARHLQVLAAVGGEKSLFV